MIQLQSLEPDEVQIIIPRVQDELNARYFYEAAKAWALTNGYDKAAEYFKKEAEQENQHYIRWIEFLSNWNVNIEFPLIPTPPKFISLQDILEKAYVMEFNLLEEYEKDALNVFPICQKIFRIMQDYVTIQNDSVIESNDLVTKAYAYLSIDHNLVLFEKENFS